MTSLLVLWDVDQTLVNARGAGVAIYELAFRQLYGTELPTARVSMAGRTDRAIAVEMLRAAGRPDPQGEVERFQQVQAEHAAELAGAIAEKGIVLAGAAEAIAALAQRSEAGPDPILQSLLTGNVRELARVKLDALGLSTAHLDLEIGAYGTESEVRADLVPIARRNAAARYGTDFGGAATVLVGDTPLDVEAALKTGARAVAVATGAFSAAELEQAGADAVLPDLADTDQVVAAILGR